MKKIFLFIICSVLFIVILCNYNAIFNKSNSASNAVTTSETPKIKNGKNAKIKYNADAIKLNNKSIKLYNEVWSLISKQDTVELFKAIDYLDQAIKLDSNYYIAYANKSKILVHIERYDEALNVLDKIIELRTDFAVFGYIDQAEILKKNMQRNNEAKDKYKKAIEICENKISAAGKNERCEYICSIAYIKTLSSSETKANRYLDAMAKKYPECLQAIDQMKNSFKNSKY